MGRAELSDESVVHHAYYQWVPFVLFGQAIMFYLPHLVWRIVEGGTIKVLVEGLQFGYLAIADHDVGKAPSKTKYMAKVSGGRQPCRSVDRTFLAEISTGRTKYIFVLNDDHWVGVCIPLTGTNGADDVHEPAEAQPVVGALADRV